jgi:glutamine---fructose-6-phosphate transaminase (isomerizing)
MAEKGGYKHFMLKEIFEQPRAVRDTTLGRVGQETGRIFLDEMDITPAEFRNSGSVEIIACGTSWHAALCGKFMIEKLARMPVEVDYGSEFRYRDPMVDRAFADHRDLAIGRDRRHAGGAARGQTQGLEDAGDLQRDGLDDHARGGGDLIYTHAGPEIGVASTKAFTCQLTALFILAMYLGQARGDAASDQSRALVEELCRIPGKLETVLSHDAVYEELARKLFRAGDFCSWGGACISPSLWKAR